MLAKPLLALALIASASTVYGAAQSSQIVSWVDENGVTHFADASQAPTAKVVEVGPANGMDVPEGAPEQRATHKAFVKIAKPPKKNKRGWRGFSSRSRAGNNRRSR